MPTVIPYIPNYITVHLGSPDSNANNVTVPFIDYIKNVASSEIYPTWNEAALVANIYAQISYALNKVYTEFYPSRGYNFDITSSTAEDQKFIYGRNIFDNIDRIVDVTFNDYIRRIGFIEPLAAKYCNGTTVTCNGLSQWGSEYLARDGLGAMEILYNYYGDDIELVVNAPIRNLMRSYPGSAIRRGDSGENVVVIQQELNRISQNYPAIPKIENVDGIFGSRTEAAVRKFQEIFNLNPDGIVGRATWYKLISIYVGVTRLSELNSEGQRLFSISLDYPDAISFGDRGEKVTILQYFLSVLSAFDPYIPPVTVDGIFGENTQNAVIAFQKINNLTPDGVVGDITWNELYSQFRGTVDNVFEDNDAFRINLVPAPTSVLRVGASGETVQALQTYLNAIALDNGNDTFISTDGIYGAQTAQAVREFQAAAGLTQTGEVDAQTWEAIVSAYVGIVAKTLTAPTQFPGRDLRLGDQDSAM